MSAFDELYRESRQREPLVRSRLKKLQDSMRHHRVGSLLLTQPMNVRFATGVSVMPIWTALNLSRYTLVPVEGDPILYEYSKALFRARAAWPNARPAIAWQQRFSQHEVEPITRRWAGEIGSQLREWGLFEEPLAVDPLDWNGMSALSREGLKLADSDLVVEHSKLVKSPEELAWLDRSCAVAEAALADMEKAIRPGITENALFGVFHKKMLALGGEMCSTRLLVSGEKTNPWFYEAGDRVLRPGDLVGIDTDMTGPEGYLCDISRTFLCGDRATADQKEAYAVARDFIEALIPLCRAGVSHRELVEKAPRYPAEYAAQGYSCMIHGAGFDDEPPFLPFPHDNGALIPHGQLAPNMVLCVEFYAGKPGKRDGVKLEEQIRITEGEPERLSRYAWDDRLAR